MSEQELLELVAKMNGAPPYSTPGKEFSWRTRQDVENLCEKDILLQVEQLLKSTNNTPTRTNLHYIIGRIARIRKDPRVVPILLAGLETETNEEILHCLIEGIREFSNVPLSQHLVSLTTDKRVSIRWSAIHAVRHCNGKDVERVLLNVVRSATDPVDLKYANEGLEIVGTKVCIRDLVSLTDHFSESVKLSAIRSFATVSQRTGYPATATLVKILSNDRSRLGKLEAVNALSSIGNESAAEAVCNWVESVAGKQYKHGMFPHTDLMHGFTYLMRFPSNKRVQATCAVLKKRWAKLHKDEQDWLRQNLQLFAEF